MERTSSSARNLSANPFPITAKLPLLLPRRCAGKVGVELGDQRRFVVTGECSFDKTTKALFIEALPRSFLVSGIDREEECVVAARRFKIAVRVPDHENVGIGILATSRQF